MYSMSTCAIVLWCFLITGIHSNFQSVFFFFCVCNCSSHVNSVLVRFCKNAPTHIHLPRVCLLQVLWSVMKVAEFTGLEKTQRVVAHSYGPQFHQTWCSWTSRYLAVCLVCQTAFKLCDSRHDIILRTDQTELAPHLGHLPSELWAKLKAFFTVSWIASVLRFKWVTSFIT